MVDILVNVVGICLILFVVWWFWLYKPKATKLISSDHVKIVVANGVYSPDVIKAPVGKPLHLEFLLKDESHCAKTVKLPDFDLSQELLLNQVETIVITPEKAGEYEFTCPMGMYRGKVIAEHVSADSPVGSIDIIVDGGVYKPDLIEVPVGNAVTLRFHRKDESHCAATVVLQSFGLSEQLPLNETKDITVTPEKPGSYEFACPMGMYKGKLIAK